MKKKLLNGKIKKILEVHDYGHRQEDLTCLLIEILNDFNETTTKYSRVLIALTIVMAALAIVTLFKQG